MGSSAGGGVGLRLRKHGGWQSWILSAVWLSRENAWSGGVLVVLLGAVGEVSLSIAAASPLDAVSPALHGPC